MRARSDPQIARNARGKGACSGCTDGGSANADPGARLQPQNTGAALRAVPNKYLRRAVVSTFSVLLGL
eukprot:scaffold13359_cov111-Isochrysis_galbana.AAC.1